MNINGRATLKIIKMRKGKNERVKHPESEENESEIGKVKLMKLIT